MRAIKMPLWEMCEVRGPANGPGTRSLFPRRNRVAEIESRAARPLTKLVDVHFGVLFATLNSSADEKGMLGYRAQVVNARFRVGHLSISFARTRVHPLLLAMSVPGATQPRGDRARPENGVAPVARPGSSHSEPCWVRSAIAGQPQHSPRIVLERGAEPVEGKAAIDLVGEPLQMPVQERHNLVIHHRSGQPVRLEASLKKRTNACLPLRPISKRAHWMRSSI